MVKEVREIIDGVYRPDASAQDEGKLKGLDIKDDKALAREIKDTEKKMLACARDLDFEQAAVLRDRLEALKRLAFGTDGRTNAEG